MSQKTILGFDKWDYKMIKVSIQPRKQSSVTANKMRKKIANYILDQRLVFTMYK